MAIFESALTLIFILSNEWLVNFPLLFVLVVGQMRRDKGAVTLGLEPGEGDR